MLRTILVGPVGQKCRISDVLNLKTLYCDVVHLLVYEYSYFDNLWVLLLKSGPGSVVGIATAYGLDGPGIESRWGRNIPHLSRTALRPTQPPVKWVPGLSRG